MINDYLIRHLVVFLSYVPEMPARLLIIATLLTIALPLLVGVSVFFVALPWWIDRLLRSDPRVHEDRKSTRLNSSH